MNITVQEVQFPTDISYGSAGGSGFSTTVFETTSGYEQRNVNWSKSRGSWDVSYGVKDRSQMDSLVTFFMAMQGKAYAFRFKDWADYYVVNQQIAVGDGATKTFQLIKTYSAGTNTFTRTIKKPVANTLQQVLVAGAPASPQPAIDTTTGLITFNAAPANGAPIVVTYCEFDVPARFDTDKLDVRQDFWQTESWQSIKIVEVKL